MKSNQHYGSIKLNRFALLSLSKSPCHAYSCLCFHPEGSAGKPAPRSFSLCRALQRLAWTPQPISLSWHTFSPTSSRVPPQTLHLHHLLYTHSMTQRGNKVQLKLKQNQKLIIRYKNWLQITEDSKWL